MYTGTPCGYLSEAYARSFSEFGEALRLPEAQGWLLKRAIAHTAHSDAMGCYPLFCCGHWDRLAADLQSLAPSLVSVVVVTDPFAPVDANSLARAFGRVSRYKEHYVAETSRPSVSRSHRESVAWALRRVEVEVCADPGAWLDEWMRLFGVLAERHAITGLRRFSREVFRRQFEVPGFVAFRAVAQGRTVGLDLWYVQDGVAQGHLVAFDEIGYRLRASYATKSTMLDYFRDKVQFVNLGAGRLADGSDGLSHFKKGFSNATRPSFLCGSVLQPEAYATLCGEQRERNDDYFPAYRAGELTD